MIEGEYSKECVREMATSANTSISLLERTGRSIVYKP